MTCTVIAPGTPWPKFQFIPASPEVNDPEPVPVEQAALKPAIKLSPMARAILEYLESHPGSYANAIAKALAMKADTVGSLLSRLAGRHLARSAEGTEYAQGGFLMKQWWSLRA